MDLLCFRDKQKASVAGMQGSKQCHEIKLGSSARGILGLLSKVSAYYPEWKSLESLNRRVTCPIYFSERTV